METRRGARGLSHQGRSSRAPQVLVDGGDSMANSIICTNNPGNVLSTLTSTDEQHPFELAREATENCERMWQQFDQVEERTQRIRSQYQLIDSLLAEIRSDCAKFEKSKEMLLQCTGIPETGAFCLQQQNTKQQKEASAQAEEAEQQDWMEVSQEQESSSWCLEQLSQESSGQGHEVAQVWREEELLAQKADLEGRLAATEWLRQDLAGQLEETRSAKESLQSRLFAAQQQMAQLEMTWKRVEAELQGELQGARREAQAAQRRHKEELQGLKEERNLLLEQREALQKQLAASRECPERTAQRAQQEGRETQEESRHKLMEIEQIQKMLDEAKHQNKELQVHLDYLEREWIQWEEMAQQNSDLQASVNALEREKARLILSLEEKDVCLRTLEEQNLALNHQVSQCQSALQQAKQLSSNRAGQLRELNTQIRALQDAVLQMEASQATQQKQLLKELEESRAGERSLRDSVHLLQAEVSELRVRLQSSDDKALALAIQCEAVELELRKTQAQRDNLRARNLELQKELEEIEQDCVQAEAKHICLQIALEKEATERQEEAVALRQEVASLRRKLEKLEKERKDVLVSQEQESSSWCLEQLSQESSGQGHEVAQAWREEELLAQKADLEGRLAATEGLRQDLARQLEETRSAKESLQSRLFAAQQQISQLEVTRNHLEAQVLTVTQAKEVIEGEVKCLQGELEAERALRRQEQEDTAQQLLQAEQQPQESLRLQGTAQQLEIKKLLQDLASERERHRAEMEETLEQWEKEKAEREQEHKKVLFEMRQKVATLLAQQEELTRFENAKQEMFMAKVLLEEQKEKSALSEALLQTQGELSRARQQVQQLRQETIKANLQGELQGARREAQAAQRRHEEELQGLKEERNLLLEQREALEKQLKVGWVLVNLWELARDALALGCCSSSYLDVLILSLEEKDVCLRTLEEQNLALNNQVSQCQSALQQAKQLSSNRAGQLRELNTQIRALQDAVLQMEASQATQQKQLLKELEESRAGERSVRDSVHVLQAEVSELRLKLQSSDDKALALAIQCEAVELELRKTQAQRDNLRARNLELQKELEEIEQDWWKEEVKHISRETALEKEATERQEEAVALRQEVASLRRKLEKLEKERKDVLVDPERRRIRTFRRVFPPDYFTLPIHESADRNWSTFEIEESSSISEEQQPSC
uniref:centrosome-associated protein CEP250-like n=1 Tax=Agelaius phoeniceus TaxID=39638 RepID=UPI0023EDABE9|nr:centrosome-associated protein CEP250-like [Agelaius phoeniceus]